MSSTIGERRLKIGLIDADLLDDGTQCPNLALLKIAGYCKARGHEYELLHDSSMLEKLLDYDLVIVSKIFDFNKVPTPISGIIGEDDGSWSDFDLCVMKEILSAERGTDDEECKVLIGGTGFFPDGGAGLAADIEQHEPDHSLYDDYNRSMESKGLKGVTVSIEDLQKLSKYLWEKRDMGNG